jgi:hypothetical protein
MFRSALWKNYKKGNNFIHLFFFVEKGKLFCKMFGVERLFLESELKGVEKIKLFPPVLNIDEERKSQKTNN